MSRADNVSAVVVPEDVEVRGNYLAKYAVSVDLVWSRVMNDGA